jgi:hypothetical protein
MSQTPTPQFLGFDVRLDPVALARGWSADRRSQYLLRDDINVPLSIDPIVWPSKFWQPHVPPGIGIPRHVGTVAVPEATPGYTILGLWADLDELKRFARDAGVAIDSAPFIAVLAWPGDEEDFVGSPPRPDSRRPDLAGWSCLGFDVADRSFISGLNNCGYEPDERASLASSWRGSLNEHGLLTELEVARRFAEMTDDRVPEHAPFLVFELRAAR